jgi:hypothetical protein
MPTVVNLPRSYGELQIFNYKRNGGYPLGIERVWTHSKNRQFLERLMWQSVNLQERGNGHAFAPAQNVSIVQPYRMIIRGLFGTAKVG